MPDHSKKSAALFVDARARLRQRVLSPIEGPLARWLVRLGVGPIPLTFLGLATAIGAGALAALGLWVPAGAALMVSGALDLLDGAVARASGWVTAFGAFLDSLTDRVGEGALFLGLVVFYGGRADLVPLLLVFLAFAGSFLVSYTRARAEGLGLSLTEGVMTRAERLLVLSVGLLVGQVPVALGVVAALAFFTAAQRAYAVWRGLRGGG